MSPLSPQADEPRLSRPVPGRVVGSVLLLAALTLASGCRVHRPVPRSPVPPTVRSDVVYGVADGQELTLDVYSCTTPGPHPACLLIHGGGWTGGDKAQEQPAGLALSRRGIVCFAPNYQLAPAYRHPAQVQDCARAARWVRAHAADYGVDPGRLGALGDSAGGQLALLLGSMKPGEYQSADDPNRGLSARVKCVVGLYGPTDLRDPAPPLLQRRALTTFIGAPPGEAPDRYADASPITRVSADTSPVLLIHGQHDPVVPLEQSEKMKIALDSAGVECRLLVVPHCGHAFIGAKPEDVAAANQESVTWLLAHL